MTLSGLMATEVDAFERATIVAFYYAINEGASLAPEADAQMKKSMQTEFPNMDQSWYDGILASAKALNGYLYHQEGTKDLTWSYAHYGGATASIPAASSTNVIDFIWDSMSTGSKNIFSGKKDSWNTADVYMVKSNKQQQIRQKVAEIINEFASPIDPGIAVGTINAYMSKLLKDKDLLGISLKKPTKGAAVNVTETNIELGPDGLEVKSGSVTTPLKSNMEVVSGRRGKDLDFTGNSLRFQVQFEAGAYRKKYTWESKVSSATAEATEPRDLVPNLAGRYITATARNGAIPAPLMEMLVARYTGESLNANLPKKLGAAEITYWQTYLNGLRGTPNVPIELGAFTVGGKSNKSTFIERLFALDTGNPSGKNFDTKIRSKMRHLRYIKMFLEADKKAKLSELISHSYFLSSKMNINQGDLAGPFIKVQ